MRRLIATLALLALGATLSLAQRPPAAPRFEPAQVVSAAELFYPPNSVGFGTVVLEVTLGDSGAIKNVKVIKDIKGLSPEAVKCVKKWKFKPAELDGRPVRSTIAVAFTFNNPFRNP